MIVVPTNRDNYVDLNYYVFGHVGIRKNKSNQNKIK